MARFVRPRSTFRVLTALAFACALRTVAGATVITVTTAEDEDVENGLCSLREAIVAANADFPFRGCPAGDGVDRIEFALDLPAWITLVESLPILSENAGIVGPGTDLLTIDGNMEHSILSLSTGTGDGEFYVSDLTLWWGYSPPFSVYGGGATVFPGDHATFVRVAFQHNHAPSGGGLRLYSDPPLIASATVRDCAFAANQAHGAGGGGAIYVDRKSWIGISGSAFWSNSATHESGFGGALLLGTSHATIGRTTFSGNEAGASGGAIALLSSDEAPWVTLNDTTVTDNTAGYVGGSGGNGGGLYVEGTDEEYGLIAASNSVIAGNHDQSVPEVPDMQFDRAKLSEFARVGGANLIGSNANDGEAELLAGFPNGQGNYVGTPEEPIAPMLGFLTDNGGPVRTRMPEPGSPLLDRGTCWIGDYDQRGWVNAATGLRPVDDPDAANVSAEACDIGAVERGAAAPAALFADGFEMGATFAWSVESSG